MIEIYDGALSVVEILRSWYEREKGQNNGALSTFVGIVRADENASALSFDIYEPLLLSWFELWEQRAKESGATLYMAHSKGDVSVHESSFIAGVASRHRKVALALINEFVEDFKACAPIWKYDVINGERIYAKERSKAIKGAGILGI